MWRRVADLAASIAVPAVSRSATASSRNWKIWPLPPRCTDSIEASPARHRGSRNGWLLERSSGSTARRSPTSGGRRVPARLFELQHSDARIAELGARTAWRRTPISAAAALSASRAARTTFATSLEVPRRARDGQARFEVRFAEAARGVGWRPDGFDAAVLPGAQSREDPGADAYRVGRRAVPRHAGHQDAHVPARASRTPNGPAASAPARPA